MAAATDQREFRFNKYGSIGRAAGFLAVATGFMIRAVVRGYEGELSVGNLIDQVTPLGAVIFTLVFVGLATVVVRSVLAPQSRLALTEDEVVFHGRGEPQRIRLTSVLAVAAYEKDRAFRTPGRRSPHRGIAVLSDDGTNLGSIPQGVRWLTTGAVDGTGRRDLVEEILADSNVLSELPNDEFGNSMRRKLTGTAAQRIKALRKDRPDLGAIVVPLQGMPTDTEDELRDTLPNWI